MTQKDSFDLHMGWTCELLKHPCEAKVVAFSGIVNHSSTSHTYRSSYPPLFSDTPHTECLSGALSLSHRIELAIQIQTRVDESSSSSRSTPVPRQKAAGTGSQNYFHASLIGQALSLLLAVTGEVATTPTSSSLI